MGGRRTAWDRVASGDALVDAGLRKALKKPPAAEPTDGEIERYTRVMGSSPNLREPDAKFIVRQWDGMDGCWTDCTKPVTAGEALKYWLAQTEGGVKRVSFSEIDYYKIFPGGTKMLYDGDNEMFR